MLILLRKKYHPEAFWLPLTVYFAYLIYLLQTQPCYFLRYSLLYFQGIANDSVVKGEEEQENGHDSSSVNEPPRKKNRKK
jgi:hypothetical protein